MVNEEQRARINQHLAVTGQAVELCLFALDRLEQTDEEVVWGAFRAYVAGMFDAPLPPEANELIQALAMLCARIPDAAHAMPQKSPRDLLVEYGKAVLVNRARLL